MDFKTFNAIPAPGGPISGDGVDTVGTFRF